MNLICKLRGHKWRNTSWTDYGGRDGNDFRVAEVTCARCNEVVEIKRTPIKKMGGGDRSEKANP